MNTLKSLTLSIWSKFRDWSKNRKLFRAENLLLDIIELDEKNAPAFNRLGIIYAKRGNYTEAIEKFSSAHKIEPSPASLHNLGLIYFEVGDYKKSATMFRKALSIENNLSTRHVAYAKVLEKLGKNTLMIQHLEKAFQLDPSEQLFKILYDAYQRTGNKDLAIKLKKAFEQNLTGKRKIMIDTLVEGTRQLVEETRQYNNELDRIAAKHGL